MDKLGEKGTRLDRLKALARTLGIPLAAAAALGIATGCAPGAEGPPETSETAEVHATDIITTDPSSIDIVTPKPPMHTTEVATVEPTQEATSGNIEFVHSKAELSADQLDDLNDEVKKRILRGIDRVKGIAESSDDDVTSESFSHDKGGSAYAPGWKLQTKSTKEILNGQVDEELTQNGISADLYGRELKFNDTYYVSYGKYGENGEFKSVPGSDTTVAITEEYTFDIKGQLGMDGQVMNENVLRSLLADGLTKVVEFERLTAEVDQNGNRTQTKTGFSADEWGVSANQDSDSSNPEAFKKTMAEFGVR